MSRSGIEPGRLHWQAESLSLSHQGSPFQTINPHAKLPSSIEDAQSLGQWGWADEELNLIGGGEEASKG